MATPNKNYELLDKLTKGIPPLRDEHNQQQIDAEQAHILREAAEQRKKVDEIEKYLRS